MNPNQWLRQGVLPVVVISSVDQGLRIAQGLCEGGITQIEITLRTPQALPAMKAIQAQFPDMALSAGTVLTPDQFDQAAEHGASLFISPGYTERLATHATQHKLAWVPGAVTASEMMGCMEAGFDVLKFFPAMAAGGPNALAGLTAPLAQLRIIPTGGVTLANLAQWKAIEAVQAVGGTWLTAGLNEVDDVVKTVAQRASQAIAAWNGTVLV